ncbi:hypothetical protein MLP_26060 [Microlunatus phosphovorus NM-1]|uniref:Uncharacterized protein n=1 Tax=Microlunatus phosphovorus (strain ATCC 700054 / DSM 10555 / JCM 9379 / NBRC 101784 / NCIMB 13414 / VKM Ac-1990 / NM-1) TaxID=1032480 RepID=F5XGY8_MICPN|nr:hypothetical protein [Microlunatus phosphovorus]BAK35620.1 hypothetical protein MLP_26060 [Microlunatus phosphovorus NM-1]
MASSHAEPADEPAGAAGGAGDGTGSGETAVSHPGHGVVFPRGTDGRRSTTAVGRAVVAAALQNVDPAGARAARQEPGWRSNYLLHFRRLVEAGVGSPDAAVGMARAGLDALRGQLMVKSVDGEVPLADWEASRLPEIAQVRGSAEPETELSVPYRGARLRGDELRRQVDRWVEAGVAEPTVAEAVGAVLDHPEWLRLEGRTVAVLGAGAEMGPLIPLLRWGARVAAVDLPRPAIWSRVLGAARKSAGQLVLPSAKAEADSESAGADLLADAPTVAAWLADVAGHDQLVVGNYVYADGAVNVRVSTAVDVLSTRLVAERPDTALGFLATPTDVFAVPGDAVRQSTAAYEQRSKTAKILGRPLRTLSGGRLLRRAYVPGADPGISDSLVAQQGPNYALAKRLQRWRATVARRDGVLVSMNVAPPTRTRSVVKNRALAAAYAGAHRFGVEVFEPSTSNVLMAALLVHDLHTGGGPRHPEPWQDEAYAAVHGGLWRLPYAPRSVLGLAALMGAARR